MAHEVFGATVARNRAPTMILRCTPETRADRLTRSPCPRMAAPCRPPPEWDLAVMASGCEPASREVRRPSSVFSDASPVILGLPHPAPSAPGLRSPSTVSSSPHLVRHFQPDSAPGIQGQWCPWQPSNLLAHRRLWRDPTNRCLRIHAGRDRQDTCPSLGHAGSHPVFESVKAPDAMCTPLTHAPTRRNTGSRAHPPDDWQRPPP